MTERRPNRGDKLRKVLTASTVRSFVDTANWVEANAIRLGAGQGKTPWDFDRVTAKNTSGVDVGRFCALGLRDPIILPADNASAFAGPPAFDVELPAESTDVGKFAVALDAIPNGGVGRAVASGVVQAYVLKHEDDPAPAAVDVLGYLPDQVGALAFLHPNPAGGAQVLWIEPDEDATAWEGDAELGDVWVGYLLHRAIVRFGGSDAAAPGSLFEVTGGQLKEGGGAVECYRLDENGARDGDPENVNPSPHDTGAAAVGPFRGVAFPAESETTGFRGDVIEAMRVGESWVAFGAGRTQGTGTADADILAEATGNVTVDTADSRSVTITAYALRGVASGSVVQWAWNNLLQRFDVWAVDTWAIFEVTEDLTEGDDDGAAAYVLDAGGARTGSTIRIYASPYSDVPAPAQVGKIGPFRGVAFAAQGSTIGLRGDVVHAIYHEGLWIALGSGRTGGSGTARDSGIPGLNITVALHENDNREIEIRARCLCEISERATVQVVWNGLMRRWDATSPCRSGDDDSGDDEDEDGDDDSGDGGDGVGSPGGDGSSGGGGNCSACSGLPNGEKCLPTECCSSDETAPVTTCESATPAYTSYKWEIEGTLCVPQAVKDAATVTYTSGCSWESAPVTADDPLTGEEAEWQWRFEPAKEGTSWLRLYKDGEIFLEYFRAGPWCYRCAQVFEVFCPPSDCSDISARVCVRPICVDACAHSTTYEITSPGDEDAAGSTVYLIDGDNAAEVTTTQDFGCPDPPSRSTIFTYGTTSSVADGAVAIDIFPETEYSPTTCGSELDFVNADVKARVIFDDTVEKLGVKYGVAVEQDGEHFVAIMGEVLFDPDGEGCTYLGRQHLKAEDFILVDGSGFDSASHPDFSATAPDMRFGIARWVMDNADGDDPAAPGHKAGTIYDNAHIQLCYAPCDGDAPAFDCPTSVNLATCVGGDVVSETITITNNGDNPFNVTGWSRTSGLNPALNPTVSPFPLTIAADPPGSLAPGAEWEMTFTLTPGDAAWTGSGYVTIHTTIGPCTFPVTATVLEDCDADDPCALFHDDTRDYENVGTPVAVGTWLSALDPGDQIEPYNGGLLSYSATLLECDTTDGSIEAAEAVENETKSGGGAQFNSGANLSASRAVIQLIDDVPANYALKAVCSADLSSYTHAIGIAFGVKAADDWWAIASTKFMLGGPSSSGFALLRQAPGAALSIVDNYFTGSSTGVMVCGIHVVGNRAKIALEDGVTVASTSLLDSSQVDKVFAEQQLAGTGVGLLRTNGEPTAQSANGSYWGELCITDQPGLVPPWEVDPP